jgi:endonuclease G
MKPVDRAMQASLHLTGFPKPVRSRAEFRSACRARDLASAHYLFNPRVRLIDVGWYIDPQTNEPIVGDLRVRVHVRQQPRGAAFEAFSERHRELVIDKERIPFPVDLVEADYRLQWFGYPLWPSSPRSRIFNPLRGGISISNEWSLHSGTLGGLVKDRERGGEMILSNWHVLAGSAYARKGLRIYQPGYADGGQFQHTIALLERHAMNQGVDAAVARLTDARPWINDQLDVGPISGITAPTLGMRVIKSGFGSDVTEGMIDGVEGEYPIEYGGFMRKIKHVYRIVPVTPGRVVSQGGDSGSWWLEKDTRRAVALHFAGYDWPETALAIAMPQVLDALGVDIAAGLEHG